MRTIPSVEVVPVPRSGLGEGARWDRRSRELLWVDIEGHKVHRYDPVAKTHSSIDTPTPVSVVSARASGGWIAALEDGLAFVSTTGGVEMLNPFLRNEPGLRLNDGRVDRTGRFWVGSMAYDQRPGAGRLFRIDPDASVNVAIDAVTISNGIDWSPDGRCMYYVDTPTRRVEVYDFDEDSGRIASPRTLVTIDHSHGFPDGLTVDSDGGIWVCLWGGAAVHQYTPEGHLELVVTLPTRQVTSCAFGGDDRDDLYVTTASSTAETEADPAAGRVFVCRPGVRGQLESEFAG